MDTQNQNTLEYVEKVNGNKAMWAIHPSVIAQRISEKDFQNMSNISGIVIQPGTSAVVYLNGKEIAQLNSGEYVFAKNEDVQKIMDQTIVDYERLSGNNSIPGFIKSGWQKIVRFVTGHKVGEAEQNINSKKRTVDEVVQHLYSSSGNNISVYLKVNSPFPTIFGYDPYKEGREAFVPMEIRTKFLNIEVCAVLLMQIKDFEKFLSYYMTYRSCISVMDIQKEIERYVRNAIQDELFNEEVNEFGISDAAKARIIVRLKELDRYLYGISVIDVPEISCNSEVFNRFREVASEIFCSEKELDYLQRSNELKNRLAAIEVAQMRSDLEKSKAIDEVNKDRLLHEDELVRFKTSLALKTEDDMAEMMAESAAKKIAINTAIIKKQALAENEIAELKSDIKFNNSKKALERVQELEEIQRKHEHNKTIEDALNVQKVTEINLGTRRSVDEYERGKKRAEVQDEIQEAKMWQELAQQNMDHMFEMDERAKANAHSRKMDELSMQQRAAMAEQQAKNEALRIYSTMGADAITATGIATGVKFDEHSAAAAAAISGGQHETAALKALLQMRENDHKEALAQRERYEERNMDNIKYVLDKALESRDRTHQYEVNAMSDRLEEAQNLKNEYREELRHQQERNDHTQDKSLEYTSKVTITQAIAGSKIAICPVCQTPVTEGAEVCHKCNVKLI